VKRYAIKIGEIHLRSGKPVTREQRDAAIKMISGKAPMPDELQEGLEVIKVIDKA